MAADRPSRISIMGGAILVALMLFASVSTSDARQILADARTAKAFKGYTASKYHDGDRPDQYCKQGDLDDAEQPFFLAKGLGCKGQAKKMTKFHPGDKVPGCDPDDGYCVAVYDGTMDACQGIAIDGVVGDNDVFYSRGDWLTWNSDGKGCYIWGGADCDDLSKDDKGDNSFQYCGMT